MKIGLPDLVMTFTQKASTVIERSARGVVVLLLNDPTREQAVSLYTSLLDVDQQDWTEKNSKYLKYACKGKPSRVLAVRGIRKEEGGAVDVAASKKLFSCLEFDWFAFPECTAQDAEALGSFFDQEKKTKYRKWKAVLPDSAADSPAVVNFATSGISIVWDADSGVEEVTTAEYTARIAGILAGVSLTQSSTSYVLDEVVDASGHEDPDGDVNSGKLILVYDGEKFKIGRGVTSLTTVSDEMPEDFRKIKLMEAADIVRTDILTTFKDGYQGKRNNTYDNKQAFIGAVLVYLKTLEDILIDKDEGYTVTIDTEATRAYLEGQGKDTSEMTDLAVCKSNTGSFFAIAGKWKFLDAMEDFHMNVLLQRCFLTGSRYWDAPRSVSRPQWSGRTCRPGSVWIPRLSGSKGKAPCP